MFKHFPFRAWGNIARMPSDLNFSDPVAQTLVLPSQSSDVSSGLRGHKLPGPSLSLSR